MALNAANAGSAESSVDQMADGNAGKLEGMLEGAVEAVSAPSSAHFDSALVTASAAAAACFAVGGLTVRTCEVHQVQQGWHFEAVVGTLGRGETGKVVSKRFGEVRLWILRAAAAAMERNPPAVAQDHLALLADMERLERVTRVTCLGLEVLEASRLSQMDVLVAHS